MEIGLALFGVIVGALVTWYASKHYYEKAARELRDETKRLHAALSALMYKLEHPEAEVEVIRDADGRITGLAVKIQGLATGLSFAAGALTLNVKPADPAAGNAPQIGG